MRNDAKDQKQTPALQQNGLSFDHFVSEQLHLVGDGQTQRLRVDLESGPISIHRFGDDNRPPRSDNLHNFRRNTS